MSTSSLASAPHAADPPRTAVPDDAGIEAVRARPEDPEAAPLLADLVVEHSTRYGRTNESTQLTEVPPSDFHPERGGAFVLLRYDGQTVAGGANRRFDNQTAEVKRMWTGLTGGGGNSTALVGTPDTVAAALLDYYDLGIRIFSTRGYDIYDYAIDFGRYVIPLVRSEVAHREQATRKELAS